MRNLGSYYFDWLDRLDLVDGKQILIADAPNDFAEKTVQLLTDTALWQRISTNAR